MVTRKRGGLEREKERETIRQRGAEQEETEKSMTGKLKDNTREEECLIQEMGQRERCGETKEQFIRQQLGEKNLFKRRERENEW